MLAYVVQLWETFPGKTKKRKWNDTYSGLSLVWFKTLIVINGTKQ